MEYISGGTYYGGFCTCRFDTGVATDADTLPTVSANKNGVDDNTFLLTVTNIDTGRYRVSGTIPAYTIGDKIKIYAFATVNSVDGKSLIDKFEVGPLQVNAIQINSTSAAAVNLAYQYDGTTGLIGNTYPSRQDQLTNIVSTGAATNSSMDLWTNLSSPVATTETGGVSATVGRGDGSYDILTNISQALDSYYETNIGGTGVPTGCSIYAAVQNGTKTVLVYGYNWVSSLWTPIGTMNGTPGLIFTQYTFALFTSMVGIGANLGKVRIRFLASAALTTITIDQLYVSYAVVNQSVGYSQGAVWVDTNNGTSGTTAYLNGTADKPALLWADAVTIATTLGLKKFHIQNGSIITLNSNCARYTLIGEQWFLSLNGQTIDGAYFEGAEVSGTGVNVSNQAQFNGCHINLGTTTGPSHFWYCGIQTTSGNNFTAGSAGEFVFVDCVSEVAAGGATIPYYTFGGFCTVSFRRYSGGADITLNNPSAALTYEVIGGGAVSVALSGADVEIRGMPRQVTITGITSASTVRLNCVTGPVSVAGTDGAVSIYGVYGTLTDTRTGSPTTINNALSPITIPDVVWDEARSGHTSVGTFGEGITSVQSNVTVGTNLDKTNYSVSAVTNDVGITQAAADKVWNTTLRALTDKINFNISGGTVTTNLDKTNYTVSAGTINVVTGDVSGSVNSIVSQVTVGTNLDKTNYSVSAVTSDVGITQEAADKVWNTTTRSLTDKINFNISGGTLTTNLDKTNYSISGGTITTNLDKFNYTVSAISCNVTVGTNLDKINYTVSAGTINAVTGDVSGSVNSVVNSSTTVSGNVTLENNQQNIGLIAASILVTSANKLVTDGSGYVTATNGGGSSLTQQQIRDAMTLSATSAVNVGSVDKLLDTINTSTSALNYTGNYVNAQIKAQDNIDFGALQKSSLNAATPISVSTVINPVTVSAGSIASVTNDVGITQAAANKVWITTTRSLTDKINFSVSAIVSADVVKLAGDQAAATALSQFTTFALGSTALTTNLVTVITVDESNNRIPNVAGTVYNAVGQSVKTYETGSNGDTSFRIDNGSYVIASLKANSNFVDVSATISGDTTITISGTSFTPTPPTTGNQTLYGYVLHGNNTYGSSVIVTATLDELGDIVNGAEITNKKLSTTTTSAGYFELALLKGGTFIITEQYNGKVFFTKTILISSADSRDISDYDDA